MTHVLDDAEIARVLSITAHPDDVDFGAAGTVARWTEAGIEVIYCVVIDGDAGGFDENFPRAEMPALRRDLARVIRQARPDRVVCPSPERNYARAGEVWIAGGLAPNHYVDVTETFPRKLAALRAHESQIKNMDDLSERLRGRLARTAELAGLPEGRLAEGFQILDTA
jgi:LmbE family N-acetylglucosaminyl deacetylase